MKLVSIPNVPLVEVGDCVLQSGPHTFTEEELAAAVEALGDPSVKRPRVGIDGLDDLFDPEAHGGEPAFGHVENMRLAANGQAVIGDLMVPDFIADKLEWAYPSRSIEGALGWESPQTKKKHELVITAVKLLGVDMPGSGTLPDLAELLAAEGTVSNEGLVLARSPRGGGRIEAGLDVDLVRRRFYDQLEEGEIDPPDGVIAWDMWVRSMRFDDSGQAYLKVEDDGSGRLFRIDYEVKGSEVAFGEFVEVVEQDIAVAAASEAARTPVAVYADRRQSRLIADASKTTAESHARVRAMNPEQIARLRLAVGFTEAELPNEPTDDQLNAALDRIPRGETPPPEGQPAEGDNGDGGEGEGSGGGEGAGNGDGNGAAAEGQPTPVAARSIPEGAVLIEAGALAELRAGAKTANDLKAKADREERDRVIAKAVSDGKFPPARREHFERLWAKDAEGTKLLLTASEADGGLAAGIVPVTETGGSPQEGDLDGDPGYDPSWLPPQQRERVLAAKAGETKSGGARIIREG